ncbi:B12-binding domain-containing radical SAM protein [Odoribacter sp. OttesenSCG-928-J03]|nr:B12-binding domain-containing radical SAM protein [Odoribacter sp. OttesenSCG-928-J03]MDL2330635.1 B12-binding domain-containing radical SAM protein [Odoribacter sp. OttesenSCG-928-A06]
MIDTVKIDALLIQLSANPYFDMVSSYSVGQLGLYYLAEYADKAGYNVKVKYYNSFDNVSELLPELVRKLKCRIVGFYVDSENIWAIRALTPSLKKACPDLHIFLGGPQVTGDSDATLQLIPHVTCGVIGEGEQSFLKLIQLELLNGETLDTINGIIYIDTNNVLKKTKPFSVKQHIDDYGFPRREKYCLDLDRISFSQIISGRGCMGKCAFCFEGGQEHSNLRIRNIDSCLNEVDYLVEMFGVKYINFVDDTFILNRARTEQFCNRMIEKYDGKIKWYCEARADILSKNIDILPLLKRAGLIKIQLGGESGCQEILDAYNKGVKLDELEFVTQKIAEAGITYIYINFIIGGAFETEKTFNKTLDFAKKLMRMAPGHVEVDSSVFTPIPGSPMYRQPDDFGLKIIDKRTLRGASCSFVFAETEELSQHKIWQLRNRFKNEISNEYTALIDVIPRKQLYEIFNLSLNYDVETTWSSTIKSKVNYRNYFEPIVRGGFRGFHDISEENLFNSTPFRTNHLSSDGVAFYRVSKSGENIKNNDLENTLITLSAGKLTFKGIVNVIKSSNLLENEDILPRVLDVYHNFDEELSVVWKM